MPFPQAASRLKCHFCLQALTFYCYSSFSTCLFLKGGFEFKSSGNSPTWESLQISFVSVFSPWQLHGVRKPHVLLEMAQYNFGFSVI